MMPIWMVYMSCAHFLGMEGTKCVLDECRSSAGTQSAPQEKKQGGARKEQRKQGPSSSSSDKDIRELRIQKVFAFPSVQSAVRSHSLACHYHQSVTRVQGETQHMTGWLRLC